MTALDITMNQLIELRLNGMRETLPARLKQARSDGLGYEEFFSIILQDEADFRRSARIKRLLKRAAFKQPASLGARERFS